MTDQQTEQLRFELAPFPCPHCREGVLLDIVDPKVTPWKVRRVLKADATGHALLPSWEERYARIGKRLLSMQDQVRSSWLLRLSGWARWMDDEIAAALSTPKSHEGGTS